MESSYYIEGLLRQASAAYARQYLGIQDAAGNNLLTNFDSSVVTAGYVVNTTPLWNDVRIPMSSVRPGASAPSPLTFRGTVRAYKFLAASTQRLEFELQVPHGFNEGAAYGIRLHVHWACGLASAAAGVGWKVDAVVADIGGTFPAAPATTYTAALVTPTGAFVHMMSPIHTFTGLHESAIIVGNIYRDAADAYAGDDVFGLSLDGHYAFQKAGSVLETGD